MNQTQTNPFLLSLSIISMIDGALERQLLADKDEAIGVCLTAALTVSIDSHAKGSEEDAIKRVEAIADNLTKQYRALITEKKITGGRRGGFARGQR